MRLDLAQRVQYEFINNSGHWSVFQVIRRQVNYDLIIDIEMKLAGMPINSTTIRYA